MTAQFISDVIGVDDLVRLVLGGTTIAIAERWDIRESILSQPPAWSIQLGWSDVAKQLIQSYPPGTPAQLFIGSALQFTGVTEARGADQPPGGGTTVIIRGRDRLKVLFKSSVRAEISCNVTTYADLVWFALQQVGLVPMGSGKADPNILVRSNAANRSIKAGVPVTEILPHRTVQQILDDTGLGGPNVGVVNTTPQAKIDETWYRFLRRHLDVAGLFLWAAADGTYVLSTPNADQKPTYRLDRLIGQPNNAGANVVGVSFEDNTEQRHSEAVIYGRGGGRIAGRGKSKGDFVDAEIQGYGFDEPIVFRNRHVNCGAEASYFARRKIGEERRSGWHLEYTVSGHSLPFIDGPSQRAVLVPDTVVLVHDEELGFDGPFYIESVVRKRDPKTTTTIRLMRPEDLVFGADPGTDSP
jgi:prophage tail gpP-like protein